MNTYEGNLVANDIKIGIVVARFNEFITSKLLSGALDNLKRENVNEKDIEVAWVPGAFEIPLIASKMAKDVEQALLKVIAKEGNLSPDEAEDYLNELREEKRYQRDVY